MIPRRQLAIKLATPIAFTFLGTLALVVFHFQSAELYSKLLGIPKDRNEGLILSLSPFKAPLTFAPEPPSSPTSPPNPQPQPAPDQMLPAVARSNFPRTGAEETTLDMSDAISHGGTRASTIARSPRRVFLYTVFRTFFNVLPNVETLPNFNRSAIMDVGANDGFPNTLAAKIAGYTAYSFEPTPRSQQNFLLKTPEAVIVEPDFDRGEERPAVRLPHHSTREHKVFLIKSGVADRNGHLNFFASHCPEVGKTCGKNNRLLEDGTAEAAHLLKNHRSQILRIPLVSIDQDVFRINGRNVFVLKVDVEGHEGSVIKGARRFLRDAEIPFIMLEYGQKSGCEVSSESAIAESTAFDPLDAELGIQRTQEGDVGTARGVQLLDWVHELGYTCYHFRGFGECLGFEKRNDLRCMWPARTGEDQDSVSFLEYSKQFAYGSHGKGLSDVVCVLNRTTTTFHGTPKSIPESGRYAPLGSW